MTVPIDDILGHLRGLVAIDTQNPPRAITADGPLVALCRDALPGFDIAVHDYGGGSVVIDAQRGRADILFNVHLDTVPVAQGWSRNPHDLLVTDDRAIGLGACDIKGAAAVLFALAARTDAPMRIVLSTDEEAGQSTCINRYLETPPEARLAVIAEPTMTRAVTRHRGIFSARMEFKGTSGHSSQSAPKSAVHDAARWIAAVIETEAAKENRLNVGRVEGGVKPNMIAASAELLFGFRAQPGVDYEGVLDAIDRAAPVSGQRTIRFTGPALPNDLDGPAAAAQARAEALLGEMGVERGAPVDFFTEASFFARAGIPATVLGPGDIAQAHTADEWVTLEQLEKAYTVYRGIVTHG